MNWDYIAGLFDGEGSLYLRDDPKDTRLCLKISNCHLETLEEVRRFLGYGQIIRDKNQVYHLTFASHGAVSDFAEMSETSHHQERKGRRSPVLHRRPKLARIPAPYRISGRSVSGLLGRGKDPQANRKTVRTISRVGTPLHAPTRNTTPASGTRLLAPRSPTMLLGFPRASGASTPQSWARRS